MNKKFELEYLIVCEKAIVSLDEKVSIINIFNRATVNPKQEKLPISLSFFVVAKVLGPEGNYNEKIELIDLENNAVIAYIESEITINNEGGNNYIANFNNIILPAKKGKYWLKVEVEGNIVSNEEKNTIIVK